MALNGTLSSLVITVAVLWAITKLGRILFSRSPIDNLPGPANHSWLKGNLSRMYDRQAWDFQDELGEKYGPVSRLSGLLGRKVVFLFDPKALHYVMVKDQYIHDQSDHVALPTFATIGPALIATTGEVHKRQRKTLNPVFSINHMRRMTPIFYRVAHTLRDTMKKSLGEGSQETDILTWMHRCALELVGQGGLGYSFDPEMNGKHNEYAQALKEFMPALYSLSMVRQVWCKFQPIIALIPKPLLRLAVNNVPSQRVQKMKQVSDIIAVHSGSVLDSKKAAFEEGEESVVKQIGEGKDIISLLMRANMIAPEEERIPDDELLGQMSFLVFAATDTTSNALTQTMELLGSHPEVQEKLRAEIALASQEADGDIPYDKLIALPYMDAICRETLRLYPPVTVLNRESRKDAIIPLSQPVRGLDGTMIQELPVEKGTTIIVGVRASNLNKEIWGDDAHEWKPERWLDPLPKELEEAHIPGVYANQMTFGGGSRACLGFKFSQLEMKVVLSTLIQSFRFSPSENTKKVQWNLAGVRYPTVGNSPEPSFPMNVELI